MGIANREYMSGGSSSWEHNARGGRWSMVTKLIVINIAVFLLQTITIRNGFMESWFELSFAALRQFQLWRLVTYDFLHSTVSAFPFHLIFNMWLIYLVGRRLEAKYGSQEFLALYLTSGVASALFFLLWTWLMGEESSAIGASGSAVCLMVIYALFWPHEIWRIWGVLPIPVWGVAAISVATDVLPMLREIGGANDFSSTAHAAHVGGMLFGFLYVRYGWNLTSGLPEMNWKSIRRKLGAKPRLKVHMPSGDSADDLDAIGGSESNDERLDRLLVKIRAEGEAALTEAEREFLADASRRMRNRRRT